MTLLTKETLEGVVPELVAKGNAGQRLQLRFHSDVLEVMAVDVSVFLHLSLIHISVIHVEYGKLFHFIC